MKIHCNTGVDIAQYGTTDTANMLSITISKNIKFGAPETISN